MKKYETLNTKKKKYKCRKYKLYYVQNTEKKTLKVQSTGHQKD